MGLIHIADSSSLSDVAMRWARGREGRAGVWSDDGMRMEGFCVGSWDSWGMRNGGWLREMVGKGRKRCPSSCHVKENGLCLTDKEVRPTSGRARYLDLAGV
jgi:hypothetical protein